VSAGRRNAAVDAPGKRRAKGLRAAQIQAEALHNATTQNSVANYAAIFEGFDELGIHPDDVKPRENVFTFNAWKALGRIVRKGQHGVRIVTRVACNSTDKETGEESRFTRAKLTTVFHISQTEPLTTTAAEFAPELSEEEQARAAGFGCVAAWKDPGFMARLGSHCTAYAEAAQLEADGEPADYRAAFDMLEPASLPAGAVNIFDL
jgi:hypothetical protein